MKWEIFIPPQDEKSMQTTLTVEAGNWLSALTSGLKQVGEQGEVASNLLCDVRGDGSLHVTDYKTRRVFQIRCLDTSPTGSLLPPPQEKSFLESKSAGRASALPPRLEPVEEGYFDKGIPPTPTPLVDHKVFFSRDENPAGSSNLVYRERLITAQAGMDHEAIANLLLHYFETLRRAIASIDGARYINLAIYPTEFKGKPPGPPTGALSWQDWKDREPLISFPSVEPAKVETSYIPPNGEAEAAGSAARPPEPVDRGKPTSRPAPAGATPLGATAPAAPAAVSPQEIPLAATAPAAPAAPAALSPAPAGARRDAQPAPSAQAAPPQPDQAKRRRTPSQQMQIGRDVQVLDTSDVLAEVFEEMQDLFLTQNQEEAAEFALNLAVKKIPVEAGSVFLADINTRELYFAAVSGPTAQKLKGQKLHMTKGIVGFAARRGAAIAISDVRKDPRFCDEFDSSSGFVTKSVVCAPVQYEGRSFGAIEILNRKGGDSFSQGEVNVVSYIATQLAEFIATSLPSAEPDLEDIEKTLSPMPPSTSKKKGKVKKGR